MGRVEKKFQKKKDREREVRKKILKKRAVSREFSSDMKKKDRLEKAVRSKGQPIRRITPELEKTLELLDKIPLGAKDTDSTVVTGFAPDICNTTGK